MMKCAVFCLAGVALLGLLGCGRGPANVYTEYADLHPVKGKVTFRGEPIPDATIRLHPVAPPADGSLVHAPSGVVDESGDFEISTYRPAGMGKGAPVGDYRATVSWRGPLKGLTEEQEDELKELIPPKYTRPQSSTITVNVQEGDNELPPIVLD